MARTELNVIQFTKYNQAIYPHDYYIEVDSETAGKLVVVEANATTNQINYNDDALIGIDGLPLFSVFDTEATHYVLKVEGFFFFREKFYQAVVKVPILNRIPFIKRVSSSNK